MRSFPCRPQWRNHGVVTGAPGASLHFVEQRLRESATASIFSHGDREETEGRGRRELPSRCRRHEHVVVARRKGRRIPIPRNRDRVRRRDDARVSVDGGDLKFSETDRRCGATASFPATPTS